MKSCASFPGSGAVPVASQETSQWVHDRRVAPNTVASSQEECASNPDPARCTVDLEDRRFWRGQCATQVKRCASSSDAQDNIAFVDLLGSRPAEDSVKRTMAASPRMEASPWVKSLRRLRVLLSEESEIAKSSVVYCPAPLKFRNSGMAVFRSPGNSLDTIQPWVPYKPLQHMNGCRP